MIVSVAVAVGYNSNESLGFTTNSSVEHRAAQCQWLASQQQITQFSKINSTVPANHEYKLTGNLEIMFG